MLQTAIDFLEKNQLELLGFLTGVIYVILSLNQNIWLWPFGILTSGIYIVVFFLSRIYADMGLSIYYVLISFYGWYHWLHGKKGANKKTIRIHRLNFVLFLKILFVTLLIYFLTSYLLDNYTDSDISRIDAFTTASSIVATWMLARKIIEHWLFWIVIDFVSVGLYIYKELYLTMILYCIYGVIAFFGYIAWKRDLVELKE